jgi:hypothetical protein
VCKVQFFRKSRKGPPKPVTLRDVGHPDFHGQHGSLRRAATRPNPNLHLPWQSDPSQITPNVSGSPVIGLRRRSSLYLRRWPVAGNRSKERGATGNLRRLPNASAWRLSPRMELGPNNACGDVFKARGINISVPPLIDSAQTHRKSAKSMAIHRHPQSVSVR